MSQRNSEYELKENNDYFTPDWVVHRLFNGFPFPLLEGGVWDPCCGDGGIVKACRARGLRADGSDLNDYGFGQTGVDFLDIKDLPVGFRHIVTNPPYGPQGKLAVDFLEHSLNLVSKSEGMLAFLLKVNFDSAKGRRHIFKNNYMFEGELRLLERIRWTNLVQAAAGPSENHSWFVWNGEGRRFNYPVKLFAEPIEAAT
jgi:hypothetical protein